MVQGLSNLLTITFMKANGSMEQKMEEASTMKLIREHYTVENGKMEREMDMDY